MVRNFIKCMVFIGIGIVLGEGVNAFPPEVHNKAHVRIVATIFPLWDFARSVAGERGEVYLLVPPGAEIHTWQPRPKDILKVSSAELFLYIGPELEPWAHEILRSIKNPSLQILEAGQVIPFLEEEGLLPHESGGHERDPHVWLDFMNDVKLVEEIARRLSRIDPDGKEVFRNNAAFLKEKLMNLDEKYRDSLSDCTQKTFIFGGHAAFGYLARRYNLRQLSVHGLSPDSHPKPRHLAEIVRLAKVYKIKVVFFERLVSRKIAQVIAKEVGAQILVLNPGVALSMEELRSGITFFDIMEKNLENLKIGLSCK